VFISSEEVFPELICFLAVLFQQADGKIRPKEGSRFLTAVVKTAFFSGHFCMALATERHRFSPALQPFAESGPERVGGGMTRVLFPQIFSERYLTIH